MSKFGGVVMIICGALFTLLGGGCTIAWITVAIKNGNGTSASFWKLDNGFIFVAALALGTLAAGIALIVVGAKLLRARPMPLPPGLTAEQRANIERERRGGRDDAPPPM